MDRRNSLKKLMAASGALVALPSWASEWSVSELTLDSSFPTREQELLSAVADTIIPAGDAIGAKSVGVDKFLLQLIEDCYAKEVQDNVKTQLNGLDSSTRSDYGKEFVQCDQLEREELLLNRSTSEDISQKDFFDFMKSETIRGFRTSKEVMTEYRNYKVAPGFYNGCVDVDLDQ